MCAVGWSSYGHINELYNHTACGIKTMYHIDFVLIRFLNPTHDQRKFCFTGLDGFGTRTYENLYGYYTDWQADVIYGFILKFNINL